MKKILGYTLIFIAIAFFGCADLDDPQPRNSISTEFAVVDRASAQAALNGVYSDMQDGDLAFDGWLSLAQYFSDETVFTGTFPTRLEFGNFNVFPANGTMATVYSDFYEVINRANNVIALVPGVEDEAFTMEERQSVIAEARFIRAHVYLTLVNQWQDVPLILEPTIDVGEALEVNVTSADEIYAQVIEDFTFAQNNLTRASDEFLASQEAATAFLARIALYRADYGQALTLASSIIDGVDLSTIPYLSDNIYSLNFTSVDGSSIPFFYGPAELGGRHSIEPSAFYMSSFEDGDTRAALSFVDDAAVASVPYGIKYPSFDAGSSGSATDPIFFIRHAEMFLIAAEAAAQTGDFASASTFINAVRSRAGLDDITLDAGNFIDAILQERLVELAMEGSHRLLDLRRTGNAGAVLGPLGYDVPCDDIWPLPQRDVDRNRNLNQNDCCNC
jgi:hypothetical protein